MSVIDYDLFGRILDFIRGNKRDYLHTFSSPAGNRVLKDLAKFCRANESCFQEDARLHAVAEGRREVWLRIQNYMGLTTEELYQLLDGRTVRSSVEKGDGEDA